MQNLHACAVVLGRKGLLITGPSGSGKTELCLALLEHCAVRKIFGWLVSDDQVFIEERSGRLVVRTPPPIAGLVELRGWEPAAIDHLPAMVADALVRMVPAGSVPRFAEARFERIGGVELPCIDIAGGSADAGVRAVGGWLGLPPYQA